MGCEHLDQLIKCKCVNVNPGWLFSSIFISSQIFLFSKELQDLRRKLNELLTFWCFIEGPLGSIFISICQPQK